MKRLGVIFICVYTLAIIAIGFSAWRQSNSGKATWSRCADGKRRPFEDIIQFQIRTNAGRYEIFCWSRADDNPGWNSVSPVFTNYSEALQVMEESEAILRKHYSAAFPEAPQ